MGLQLVRPTLETIKVELLPTSSRSLEQIANVLRTRYSLRTEDLFITAGNPLNGKFTIKASQLGRLALETERDRTIKMPDTAR